MRFIRIRDLPGVIAVAAVWATIGFLALISAPWVPQNETEEAASPPLPIEEMGKAMDSLDEASLRVSDELLLTRLRTYDTDEDLGM